MRNFTSRTSFVPRRNRNGATTYGTATQYGISRPNGVQAPSSSDSSSLLTEIDGLRDSLKDKVSKSELIHWHRSPYTADHASENDYQKVLTIDYNSSLWLNAVAMCFGSKADNQIWLNTLGDVTLTMIFGWDFVVARNGDKTTLYVKTFKYDTPAVPSYTFQVVQYTGSEIVWHDNEFETLSKVTTARAIYQPQPPKKEDSVLFDIQDSAARLQMDNSINFIGDVKDSSSTAVLTVSGNEVSKMYQFTFTKTLGGLTIKSVGGVQYCSISETILQGDVVTFTVVSNSTNGWIYSKQGAAIQSSDGSVKVNWIDGIADLSVPGGGGFDPSTLAKVATSGSSADLVDGGYLLGNSVTKIEDEYGVPSGSSSSPGTVSSLKGKVIVSTNYLSSWINKYTPFIIGKFKALLNSIKVRIEALSVDANGKVSGYSSTNLEDITEFEDSLITSNYFNLWIEKYKPEAKPQYYKITENEATIPDDADIVEVDIVLDETHSTEEMIKIFLPQNPKHFSKLKIFLSQCKIGTTSKSLYVWRNNTARYSIYSFYEKQVMELYYNPSTNYWCYQQIWYSDDGIN